MKKILILFVSLIIINNVFIISNTVLAAAAPATNALNNSITKELTDVAGAAQFNPYKSPVLIIGSIISVALGLLGVIFVILMIYAGFLWMTAGGNEETVKKAKKWLANAVIGLIIVLAAYAISTFVIQSIIGSTV
jgi:hypothetical protein